jgi:hypothetical protein
MEIIAWIQANQSELLTVVGALWTIASVYVALTPNKRDDEEISRFRVQVLERLSFLAPRDVPRLLSVPGLKERL